MHTKLTVRVEVRSVANAKRFAAGHGATLSALVDAYLRRLPVEHGKVAGVAVEDVPVLQRLTGSLDPTTSIEDYHRHLVAKYES